MDLIAEFDVRTDDGEVIRLHVYREQLNAGAMGDPHKTVPGIPEIRTADGISVNWKGGEPEQFEIIGDLGSVMATRILLVAVMAQEFAGGVHCHA